MKFVLVYLIQWRIYASVRSAIIGPNHGWSPDQRHAIIWTDVD